MQKLLLVYTIAFIVRAELCPGNVAYDCKDLTTNFCTGSVGGRTCTIIDNNTKACNYETCTSLSSVNCQPRLLDGEQCFKNKDGSCAGAKECRNFDNKNACKTFQGDDCFWNADYGSCDKLQCKDLTKDKCLNVKIIGQSCKWNESNYGMPCYPDKCSSRKSDSCIGNGEGIYCFIDNYGCRQKTCQDWSIGAASAAQKIDRTFNMNNNGLATTMCQRSTSRQFISDTSYCYDQIQKDSTQLCSSVSDCNDHKSQNNCENQAIPNITCHWSKENMECRRKTCNDLTVDQCHSTINNVNCINIAGKCTSCGQISKPCECLTIPSCVYIYIADNYSSRCTDRVCSVFNNPGECNMENTCQWNQVNLKCLDKPPVVLQNQAASTSASDPQNISFAVYNSKVFVVLLVLTQVF